MKSIKCKLLLFVVLMLFSIATKSQSFNNPESISFDKKTNSFFISNNGTGDIQKIDKHGTVSTFVSGYSSFLGIKIHKGIIYCAENIKNGDDFVRGFSKKTGELVFSLSIPETVQLNDVEIDNKGNLYVSDRGGNNIYKVNLKTQKYVVINKTIQTPNGLYFDKKSNSLLVCNTVEKSSIYKIDLQKNKTKLLVNSSYSNLDGITIDKKGIIYLTSWSLDWEKSILLKYDGKQFYELLTNNFGMADIEYNEKNKTIAIANFVANSVMSYILN